MKTFESVGLRVLIVRPGMTELDEQQRIAGSLDVPLSARGMAQIETIAAQFTDFEIDRIYTGPSSASRQTAKILADGGSIQVRMVDELTNFNYGLWHGKRIDELRETQPRLFRKWQEQPSSVHPPNGETVEQLVRRVERVVKRIRKKRKHQTIVVVAAEPVACILRSMLDGSVDLYKYWTVDANCGTWDAVTGEIPQNLT